jgi:hypothetical protein
MMQRFWLAGGLILSIVSTTAADMSERLPVDLLLVLANDTSGSVYQDDLVRTRNAYRAAMTHPRVLHAVQSGPFCDNVARTMTKTEYLFAVRLDFIDPGTARP